MCIDSHKNLPRTGERGWPDFPNGAVAPFQGGEAFSFSVLSGVYPSRSPVRSVVSLAIRALTPYRTEILTCCDRAREGFGNREMRADAGRCSGLRAGVGDRANVDKVLVIRAGETDIGTALSRSFEEGVEDRNPGCGGRRNRFCVKLCRQR